MIFDFDLSKDFEVKVGAHKVKVRFVPEHNKKLTEGNEEANIGIWHPKDFTIYIDKTVPQSVKLATLLHELIHSMEYIYSVKLNHFHLNQISECFAQILVDNFQKEE